MLASMVQTAIIFKIIHVHEVQVHSFSLKKMNAKEKDLSFQVGVVQRSLA